MERRYNNLLKSRRTRTAFGIIYVRDVMNFRKNNPAIWRGQNQFNLYRDGDAEILIVTKTDYETNNQVIMIFSDRDADVTLYGETYPIHIEGYIPKLIKQH